MSNDVSTDIVSWLRARKPEIERIDLDQNLLESGALDSLQFVTFLLFVEQLRGESIPQDLVVPENFRSVNAIVSCFFARTEGARTSATADVGRM
jgi:acyl carrier protein